MRINVFKTENEVRNYRDVWKVLNQISNAIDSKTIIVDIGTELGSYKEEVKSFRDLFALATRISSLTRELSSVNWDVKGEGG